MGCRCGATWGGRRAQHCPACHETFTGDTAGDMHRVGPFHPKGARRCLTPTEMEAKGMRRNTHGVWTSGGTWAGVGS